MLSIGTIEILLGAGLLAILVLVLVVLRATALRFLGHDEGHSSGDREPSHLAQHALAVHRQSLAEHGSAQARPAPHSRGKRSRRERAA